jgi:hypothetical protein
MNFGYNNNNNNDENDDPLRTGPLPRKSEATIKFEQDTKKLFSGYKFRKVEIIKGTSKGTYTRELTNFWRRTKQEEEHIGRFQKARGKEIDSLFLKMDPTDKEQEELEQLVEEEGEVIDFINVLDDKEVEVGEEIET